MQNIDLMNLAGFCRNCLSNWYRDAAKRSGVDLSKDESREIVYGMPYAEWQALHQTRGVRRQEGRIRGETPEGPLASGATPGEAGPTS